MKKPNTPDSPNGSLHTAVRFMLVPTQAGKWSQDSQLRAPSPIFSATRLRASDPELQESWHVVRTSLSFWVLAVSSSSATADSSPASFDLNTRAAAGELSWKMASTSFGCSIMIRSRVVLGFS